MEMYMKMFKEPTSRMYANHNALLDLVSMNDKVIIFRHVNPDPDALGSQNALAIILRQIFPNKIIECAGSTPDNLKWMDNLRDQALKCYPTRPKRASDQLIDDSRTFGIVLDTANLDRIDGDYEGLHEMHKLFKIDHHPVKHGPNLDYCNVFIETNASSTSEMIARMFDDVVKESHDRELLALLYAGIAGDTGRFMYDNTTRATFNVVGNLLGHLSSGSRHDVNMKLNSINEAQANLVGYAYMRRYYLNDNVVSLFIPYSQIRGGHEADAYVTIGALQRLEKPEIVVVAVENEDGSYRIHLRSKFKPINELAAKYNGGGHPLAAGAKAKDRDEVAKLFHELAEEW